MTEAVAVAAAALVTALATGLGAVPFGFLRSPSRRLLGVASAAAGGFMLAAALILIWEGIGYGISPVVLGCLFGAAAMLFVRRRLRHERRAHLGALRGADAVKALAIIGIMTAHSFAEGVGLGVSYRGGDALGVFVTIAIAIHNIPEGLAIALILVPRGSSVRSASAWGVVSSLPQPLMAVPAFLFVETFAEVLPYGLGFAAGAMASMVLSELIPDARREARPAPIAVSFGAAFAAMMALQLALLPT